MTHEFETIRGHSFLRSDLHNGSVVVDLGANRGEFSAETRRRFGCTCLLVEPNPELASTLRAAGEFRLWECAVGDFNGSTELHVAEDTEWSTILPRTGDPNSPGQAKSRATTVKVCTLETLVQTMELRRIDLLKMDIEGAEVSVLHGVDAAILGAIGQVTVEFHGKDMFGFDLSDSVEDVIDLMKHRGFMCLDFSGGTRCDVLFINRTHHRIPRLQELRWTLRTSPPDVLRPLWTHLPAPAKRLMRPLLMRASGTLSKT